MPRKYWIIAVAIPLLLVAADAVYWRIATERLRAGFRVWQTGQATSGWIVESGPLSAGGWPRSAAITVPNLTLRHTALPALGDVDVASAAVTLSVSLLDPTMLGLSLTGPVHVRIAGVPDAIVTSDEASVLMPLRQTGLVSVAFHGSGLRLEAATGAWHVTAGLLNANVDIAAGTQAADPGPAATFSVAAEAIALPATIKWPLGANLSSLSMDGRLNGSLPWAGPIARWAESWRDSGGSMEISHFAMGWGPLGLTGSATMALDDQLQPMGSGNARIAGYADTLDRLAAAGLLTKSVAVAAKAILSLMAGTSDTDQPASVDVPLTLQFRTLSMRQVPLVRFPELDWQTR